uniref:Zinc finger protein 3-like n=1 Tax=Erpetoichthys calabaricus TaxID=27687 RepID=A0A8C4SVL1_ERPCA
MERRLSCSVFQEHFASLKAALDTVLLNFTNSVDSRFADFLLEMSEKEKEIESLKLQLHLSRSEVRSMRKYLRTADVNFTRSTTGGQTASGKAQQFSAVQKEKTASTRPDSRAVRVPGADCGQRGSAVTSSCRSLIADVSSPRITAPVQTEHTELKQATRAYRHLPQAVHSWRCRESAGMSDCATAGFDIKKATLPVAREIMTMEKQPFNKDLHATLQNLPNPSSCEGLPEQSFGHNVEKELKASDSHFLGACSEQSSYNFKEENQVCGSAQVKEELSEMEEYMHVQLDAPSVESAAQSHLAIDGPEEVRMESSNFTVQEQHSQVEVHMYKEQVDENYIPRWVIHHQHNRHTESAKHFAQNTSLQEHLTQHSGEKRFSCTQCGKSFNYLINLKSHQRIHTGEKPYSCAQCGKAFSHLTNLKIHERIHTGEKPYRCAQCGKSFNQSTHLKIHQRIHTGEKPYSCPECGKTFNQSGPLKIHRSIHTGKKPYPCSVCGKSFNQSALLKSHLKIHERAKPQC